MIYGIAVLGEDAIAGRLRAVARCLLTGGSSCYQLPFLHTASGKIDATVY